MGDSEYSFSLTTFSRTGKLLPLEYALNAVANGRTVIGICCKNGVVLVTDKTVPSTLCDSSQVYKIESITSTTGVCFAGLGPDYRVLVKSARKSAQAYTNQYGETEPVKMLVRDMASVCQEYTQRGGVRPFGVSLLAAGLEADMVTPALYQIDPSGTYFQWRATAIGKNYVSAKSFLEKRWSQDMEIEDGIHTALLTLREGFEGEMTCHNIEVGIVTLSEKVFRTLTPNQIQDYLDEAN